MLLHSGASLGRIRWTPLAAVLALLLSACGASNQGLTTSAIVHGTPARSVAPQSAPRLAWPPATAVARHASDDFYPFTGVEYAQKGGDTTEVAPSLLFGGTQRLNWATYALGGFGADVALDSVDIDFAIGANPPTGTAFYFGLANFTLGRWEWYTGNPPSLSITPASGADYISPTGFAYVAAVFVGGGTGQVDSISFNRTGAGAKPAAPQNLQGSATWYSCDLSWDPVPGATGYNLYRSQSPTMTPSTRVTNPPAVGTNYTDNTVAPAMPYYYAVRAIRGVESVNSNVVNLNTDTEDLQPPADLTATGQVGSITVSWTAAPGAKSYNVYRSSHANLSNEQLIANPTGTSFSDINVTGGTFYYYRLTSKRTGESTFTPVASAFCPEANLDIPTNLHIISQHADETTIGWDWAGADPSGFKIYVKNQQHFALEPPYFEQPVIVEGMDRSYTIQNLPGGSTYYCRICAVNASNQRGPVTDDIEIFTPTYWTMGNPETIGTGTGPLKAIPAGGDVSIAYEFDSVGGEVRFGRRALGSWSTYDIDLSPKKGGYVDLQYASGADKYIVFTQELDSKDLWGSEGNTSGAWAPARIDGDGNTALGSSLSGNDICSTVTGTDFAVAHYEISYVGQTSFHKILYQKRAIGGGAWSRTVIRDEGEAPTYQSMVWNGSDILMLNKLPTDNLLYFGKDSDSFMWNDINPGGTAGAYNDLTLLGGELYTPSVDAGTGVLSVMHSASGASWDTTPIDADHGFLARAAMAAGSTQLYVTYLANSPVGWYLAVFDGASWSVQKLRIPNGLPGQYLTIGNNLTVTALGDIPYFILDSDDGNLYCANGIPPA